MISGKNLWRITLYLLPFGFLALVVPLLLHLTPADFQTDIQRLEHAASTLSERELDELLASGIPIDARDETGKTALTLLSWDLGQRSTEAVRLLIRKGAAVNAMDRNGMTALMAAAMAGESNTVDLLIKNGAEVDGFNLNKSTALNYATNGGSGKTDTVRILLAAGANPNGVGDSEYETPLYQAASSGQLEIVKLLLTQGAKIPNKDNSGALIKATKHGHSEIVALLLQYGAQVNGEQRCSIIRQKIHCGDVPLAAAVENGNIDLVKTFLEKGADPNAKDQIGRSLVEVAREKGYASIGILLLKAGAKK
jgi:uncharacterized protein